MSDEDFHFERLFIAMQGIDKKIELAQKIIAVGNTKTSKVYALKNRNTLSNFNQFIELLYTCRDKIPPAYQSKITKWLILYEEISKRL